jgi:hypothetical protein
VPVGFAGGFGVTPRVFDGICAPLIRHPQPLGFEVAADCQTRHMLATDPVCDSSGVAKSAWASM